MKLPRLAAWLAARLTQPRRAPDFVIGGGDGELPYLCRWWLIPRNPICNVYLHHFLRSDDDRALHDHPWPSVSLMLRGRLREWTFAERSLHVREVQRDIDVVLGSAQAGPLLVDEEIQAGALRFRGPRFAHRLELAAGEDCWTLFVTGPVVRAWGFWCEGVRWVHWTIFTDTRDGRSVTGRGCE